MEVFEVVKIGPKNTVALVKCRLNVTEGGISPTFHSTARKRKLFFSDSWSCQNWPCWASITARHVCFIFHTLSVFDQKAACCTVAVPDLHTGRLLPRKLLCKTQLCCWICFSSPTYKYTKWHSFQTCSHLFQGWAWQFIHSFNAKFCLSNLKEAVIFLEIDASCLHVKIKWCRLDLCNVCLQFKLCLALCDQSASFMARTLGTTRVVQFSEFSSQTTWMSVAPGRQTAVDVLAENTDTGLFQVKIWRHEDYWDTFVFFPLLLLFDFGVCGYCGHPLGRMFSILERLCGLKMLPQSKECNIDFGQTASQKIKKIKGPFLFECFLWDLSQHFLW